jgi:hypothetical protein
MEKLEVNFGNALEGGLGMMPAAGALASIQSSGLGGFRLNLEDIFSSFLFLLDLGPVQMALARVFTTS